MFFKKSGILGINARNLLYIRPYNKKKAIKLADDKIKTKQFLSARGIPVPKLFAIIKDSKELEKFDFNHLPYSFVLKPNTGYGGEGIIPIIGRKDNLYIGPGNKKFTAEDLKEHTSDVLDGRFSLSNVADYAFFEQYIVADERLAQYSYEGLSDIRVVVHNLIPVMAMLRLPTKESEGKANLHQGAVGVGIDIAKGQCTHITYKNKIIPEIPNGLGVIKGFKIPYWDEILKIASQIQLVTNLGYMAVDICIDKNSGPVLLEINARAGLGVQIANLAPLRKRLERIEGIKVTTPAKGVRVAKDMFGNVVEKEIANISGKELIGIREHVDIIQKNGTFRVNAKIDTGESISIIDEETAEKAGLFNNTEDYNDEKSMLKIKFTLKNKRVQTIANVEKIKNKDYKMIIGQRDLKNFLIDPSINKEKTKPNIETDTPNTIHQSKINYQKIDDKLLKIDNKLKLLYYIRPLNLESEKDKFFKNKNYNPQFEYPQLKFDPLELVQELNKINPDDSALGRIFNQKKEEIHKKIELLESIDEENFTKVSIELFGRPGQDEIQQCLDMIAKADKHENNDHHTKYTAQEAKVEFEKAFTKYNLRNWKVKLKEEMVSNCVAGKMDSLFLKKDALFTKEKIASLIVHEIETHILTAENGKFQPYEIFRKGLSNYLTTQEGMAMYNVEKQMNIDFKKNYKAMSHVVGIHAAIQSSFAETFQYLRSLEIPEEQAFRSCLKAKRGFNDTGKKGAFTKDYIYFKGYYEVKKFIENGGELRDLYIGKFNLNDLAFVKQIEDIKEASLLPTWLK